MKLISNSYNKSDWETFPSIQKKNFFDELI